MKKQWEFRVLGKCGNWRRQMIKAVDLVKVLIESLHVIYAVSFSNDQLNVVIIV